MRPCYAQAPQGVQVGQQLQQQAVAPERPSMPVPPQPQQPANAGDFWNNFGNVADRDPQNAWRYLNSASRTLRSSGTSSWSWSDLKHN